jgi:hypothetical protein
MAITSKKLYRGAASVTPATTLYTAPAGTTTVVTNIVITNTAGASGNFSLSLAGVSLATTVTVGAYDATVLDIKQVINATEVIAGSASATSINFHISGVEIV